MNLRPVALPLLLCSLAVAQDGGILAVRGLDPVELCQGKEVEGVAELGLSHFLYRYRFASEASMRTFQADPERYAVQLGGACARMGPLSGRGAADRFAVHDGRIYLFASDDCRTGFLRDPERCLPKAAEPWGADAAATTAGDELLRRLLAAHGGKAAIAAVKSLQLQRRSEIDTGKGKRTDTWMLTVRGDSIRLDQAWGDYRASTIVDADGGSFVGNDGKVEPMHPTAVQELRLLTLRQPPVLLQRLAAADARVAAAGNARIGDADVQLLECEVGGARTTLAVAADGRLLQLRYRGRGPDHRFGTAHWLCSDFREVSGIQLPFGAELEFDGEKQPDSARLATRAELDPELPADYFAPTRR